MTPFRGDAWVRCCGVCAGGVVEEEEIEALGGEWAGRDKNETVAQEGGRIIIYVLERSSATSQVMLYMT